MGNVREISVAEFSKVDTRQIVIADVRTPMEYSEKRLVLPTALAPVGELNPQDFALRHGLTMDTPVYTLCASGNRAKKAAQLLSEAGFRQVAVIAGGLAAWQEAGLPTTGKGGSKTAGTTATLDRQVRIAAGLLTALFTLLACFVNIYFVLLTFFVAGGQIFSGITNWCGLGLLLAKAPWNKNASCSSGVCTLDKKPSSSPGASCQ